MREPWAHGSEPRVFRWMRVPVMFHMEVNCSSTRAPRKRQNSCATARPPQCLRDAPPSEGRAACTTPAAGNRRSVLGRSVRASHRPPLSPCARGSCLRNCHVPGRGGPRQRGAPLTNYARAQTAARVRSTTTHTLRSSTGGARQVHPPARRRTFSAPSCRRQGPPGHAS